MTSESERRASETDPLDAGERAELARLRALLEHSLEVINLLDARGTVLYRSPARIRPLGYEDGFMGHNALEIIHEDDRARALALLRNVVTAPRAVVSDVFRVRHADGAFRWLAATATNLLGEPNVDAVVLAYRDVTEQKRAEEEAQRAAKLASAGALAGALGHEINNPLTALTLSLEASVRELSSSNTDEARAAMGSALDSARRISAIAAGLRVFVQGGEIALEPVDVGVVLERALAQTSYLSGPSVGISKPPEALHVQGEESNLVTLFTNLVANALEAQAPGACRSEVWIHVNAEVAESAGFVRIDVCDNGVGIAEEHLQHAREAFFSTKRELGRSGLGLTVAQRIVEQLGGRISIESTLGVGTTASVWLRRSEPLPPDEPDATSARGPPISGRVLVVDDDPLVSRSIVKLLKLDHDVVAVKNGQEALERIRAGDRYDVILCDVLMPRMSGIELHAELERLDPALARTVVFITGGGSSQIEEFLRRSGRSFLNKPANSAQLRAIVAEEIQAARRSPV
jgi:PAS domain S-box-containing protein